MASAEARVVVVRSARLTAALALSLLGACATGEGRHASPVVPPSGDVSTDDGYAVLEGEGLQVVATYTAASGRTCRRLAASDGRVVSRVSCHRGDGRWTLGRTLDVRGPE